ncbi:hypothetical protein ACGFH8_00415 [Micromonospora sp. NPDC049175]|uniref:hypothetical protein n=1 Tax=Micromonospora sp. NPDC049175 TaxID=3364266 RepID=UPI0037166906
MRGRLLVGVVLTLTFVGGCTSPMDRVGGDAAPAGSPSASVSPTPSDPASATPSPTAPASPTPATSTTGPAKPPSEIRRTDWPNAVINNLKFCGGSATVTFRSGSNGAPVPCRILPGGARPVYAEFLVEEPAIAPSTEDALVLVQLGDPGSRRAQALVPVQLSDTGGKRSAWRPILIGSGNHADEIETFISYRVVGEQVQATVRKLDGSTEKRQWRNADGHGDWELTTVS